jgi:hypothetical protein
MNVDHVDVGSYRTGRTGPECQIGLSDESRPELDRMQRTAKDLSRQAFNESLEASFEIAHHVHIAEFIGR